MTLMNPTTTPKAGAVEDVAAWRMIDSAPLDVDRIIVTDGCAITAVAFYEAGEWFMGRRSQSHRSALDFAPAYWMPSASQGNPLRAAFPDARPPMWPRPTVRQHLEQGATAGVAEMNEQMFGQGDG